MKLKIAFLIGIIFFVAGLLTLTHYGINWDTINHLPRGQTYLHYFLTGRKDYGDLQPFRFYWQDPRSLVPSSGAFTRSMYQNSETNFNFYMQYDGYGHPPLSDILSSVFNRILFGKLRLINDVDSYRVYGILLAAVLVGFIFWWVSKYYGKFAGFVASASLALYPLFWSEMHFNTEKDVPETVLWTFFMFSVWKGVSSKKIRWIIASGVIFGWALGTKFNILFSVFAVVPWVVFYIFLNREKIISKINIKILVAAVAALVIGLIIFVITWPYLWSDPLGKIVTVIKFYKDIGTTPKPDLRFVGPLGTSTYPIQWIMFTTPPLILILSLVGIFVALKRTNIEKNKLSLLILIWFMVPIARVTWHGAVVYGGIRQIMEYLPAMAMLAGIGASFVVKKYKLISAFVILIILLVPIIKDHPNENTYFNFLIGGLSGAKEKNFPSWGNSFGAGYRQAVIWVNENAEKNAKVAFAYELLPNVPTIFFRSDLDVNNSNRSGFYKQGEYVLTLTFDGTENRSYFDSYLNKEIEPVYTSSVDGVPVVEVWKNDLEHTKTGFKKESVIKPKNIIRNENGVTIDIGREVELSRMEGTLNEKGCSPLKSAYVEVSRDGKDWKYLPGVLPDDWLIPFIGEQPKNGKFIHPFSGETASYIKVSISPTDACLKKLTNVQIWSFQ
jgi:hypothetical protein